MKLYLVRHAEAKSHAEDPDRDLTEAGIHEANRLVEFLYESKRVNPEVIFHSDKVRAAETALIFAQRFNPPRGVQNADHLTPGADPSIWEDKLNSMFDDIMLVSHLPFLSKLASLLITGDEATLIMNFDCVSILCLERRGYGQWMTDWMIRPDLLKL